MRINKIDNTENNMKISSNSSISNSDSFSKTLDNAMKNNDDKQIKKACKDFESYFLNMMFKSMRKTVSIGGMASEKSRAETLFQEMLDEKMCEDMSKSGGLGIADMMYKQISSTMDYAI